MMGWGCRIEPLDVPSEKAWQPEGKPGDLPRGDKKETLSRKRANTMDTKTFTITKRDGATERFSLDKIMNAIIKAFEAVDEQVDLGSIAKILSNLDIHNGITVEEIQNQVEVALMKEGYYKVAKCFMLYRQRHTEDRETMEKLRFLSDYVDAANAATPAPGKLIFDVETSSMNRSSER